MSNKKYYDYIHIHEMVNDISFQMYKDNWRPDYIVGLTRGGLIPAVIMSNTLGIPMETLKVSLRDSDSGPESNLWMAEDAFGYDYPNEIVETHPTSSSSSHFDQLVLILHPYSIELYSYQSVRHTVFMYKQATRGPKGIGKSKPE